MRKYLVIFIVLATYFVTLAYAGFEDIEYNDDLSELKAKRNGTYKHGLVGSKSGVKETLHRRITCKKSEDNGTLSPEFVAKNLAFEDLPKVSSTKNGVRIGFDNFLKAKKCLKLDLVVGLHENQQLLRFKNTKSFDSSDLAYNKNLYPAIVESEEEKELRAKIKDSTDEDETKRLQYKLFNHIRKNSNSEEKLYRCLANKYPGFFKKVSSSKKDKYSLNLTKLFKEHSGPFKIDANKHEMTSKNKTSKYYFSTHESSFHGANFRPVKGKSFSLRRGGPSCFNYVDLGGKGPIYAGISDKDKSLMSFTKSCLNNDPLKAMQEVSNLHHGGNSRSLVKSLSDISLKLVDTKANALEKIWDKKSIKLEEAANKLKESEDDKDTKKALKKYLNILAQIDEEVVRDGTNLLAQLEVMYNELDESELNDDQRDKISSMMDKLRLIVGNINDGSDLSVSEDGIGGQIIDKIKHIATDGQGKKLAKLLLRSREYGFVCSGESCDETITMTEANDNINSGLKYFRKEERHSWRAARSAYNGNRTPLDEIEDDIYNTDQYIRKSVFEYRNAQNRISNDICGQRYDPTACMIFRNSSAKRDANFKYSLQGDAYHLANLKSEHQGLSALYKNYQERDLLSRGGRYQTNRPSYLDQFFTNSALNSQQNPNALFNMFGPQSNPQQLGNPLQGHTPPHYQQQGQMRRPAFDGAGYLTYP